MFVQLIRVVVPWRWPFFRKAFPVFNLLNFGFTHNNPIDRGRVLQIDRRFPVVVLDWPFKRLAEEIDAYMLSRYLLTESVLNRSDVEKSRSSLGARLSFGSTPKSV
jgi:hypothetical protein